MAGMITKLRWVSAIAAGAISATIMIIATVHTTMQPATLTIMATIITPIIIPGPFILEV